MRSFFEWFRDMKTLRFTRSENYSHTLDASRRLGCTLTLQGNRCCVCHRWRWGPVGRLVERGPQPGFPTARRRRLSLRCGGIAVVAAVRFDPAAAQRCAPFFLPHVSVVFSWEILILLFFLSKGDILAPADTNRATRSSQTIFLNITVCE